MKPDYLPCVEIGPPSNASSSVIWLHGLGADGHDFEPIVPELGLSPELPVRFLFPHAPAIPVTLNMGMVMPAWYDIRGADLNDREDLEGLRQSAVRVQDLIDREVERGISPERIVLAGFSQGGAVALYLALRYPHRLAGILGLSTYLVGESLVETERHPANQDTPIFMAHGRFDPMVHLDRGESARLRLHELGYQVTWQEYPMMHEVCMEEVREVGRWLGRILDGTKTEPGSPSSRMVE